MVDFIVSCFAPNFNGESDDRFIKWDNDNSCCAILNVDGSCLSTLVRADFGGVIQNNVGFYLSDFFFDIFMTLLTSCILSFMPSIRV